MNTEETSQEKEKREQKEKWNNLLFYKIYATNEERDKTFSVVGALLLIVVPPTLIVGYIVRNGLHLRFMDWVHSFKF